VDLFDCTWLQQSPGPQGWRVCHAPWRESRPVLVADVRGDRRLEPLGAPQMSTSAEMLSHRHHRTRERSSTKQVHTVYGLSYQ
jgi:hypothetical protein